MNAHVERFNRTIQEQFVEYHEDLLFDDLAAFNRKLADWLPAYNTVLPHHSLARQSPVQFLIQHQPECQRWWTHTSTGLSSFSMLISPSGSPVIRFLTEDIWQSLLIH